jgi:hypothetical protein
LGQGQGSTTNTSWFGSIGGTQEPAFQTVSNSYNGNVGNGATGVKALDLTIATPAIGGTAIDMIRPGVLNEQNTNPGKLNERYYRQASLRILLADYGPSGTCADSDLVNLPMISGGPFVDLAWLAWDTSAATPPLPAGGKVGKVPGTPGNAAWFTAGTIGTSVFPLPISGATSNAVYTPGDGYWYQKGFPTETGCIRIDYQKKDATGFVDVTQEVLRFGWTGRNINPPPAGTAIGAGNQSPLRFLLPKAPAAQVKASGPTINGAVGLAGCGPQEPSPNSIIRLARVRDNPSTANAIGGCTAAGTAGLQLGTDEWPNVLYDPREANLRDTALAVNALNPDGQVTLAGAMHYVELDVNNLDRWFSGTLGASGGQANNTTGYTVYFSDRRGDRKDPNSPASTGPGPAKTGAFGYDDIVNPASASGCPDNALANAEDFESDFVHGTDLNPPASPRIYGGQFPTDNGVNPNNLWSIGLVSMAIPNVLNAAATANNPNCVPPAGKDWPFAVAADARDLRENAPVFFRRALKIVNGSTITLGQCDGVACGLTVVAENPIYVQGDYNAGLNGNFATPFVAASVIGDAVTLLSDNWNDVNSFAFPYAPGTRAAVTTTYRMAIVGGKTIPFKQPTVGAVSQDFGTDGGVHNFLRYIEAWGGQTLWYKGSIVALFYSHQGVGTFKCCTTVYGPPTRGYSFQTEFLTPTLLPPRTPMFRDINTLGFTQLILQKEGVD